MSLKNTDLNLVLSYEYYNKGLELEENGDNEQAIQFFEKAITKCPTNSGAIHHRNINLIKLGKFKDVSDTFLD